MQSRFCWALVLAAALLSACPATATVVVATPSAMNAAARLWKHRHETPQLPEDDNRVRRNPGAGPYTPEQVSIL
jgi:hypothetical protein